VISGDPLKLAELFSLFDEFPSNFEVVEPRKATIE
jgi:alkyl sulfatase BDS1-like metallo-beta-lactamase superfamily hydrolase